MLQISLLYNSCVGYSLLRLKMIFRIVFCIILNGSKFDLYAPPHTVRPYLRSDSTNDLYTKTINVSQRNSFKI